MRNGSLPVNRVVDVPTDAYLPAWAETRLMDIVGVAADKQFLADINTAVQRATTWTTASEDLDTQSTRSGCRNVLNEIANLTERLTDAMQSCPGAAAVYLRRAGMSYSEASNFIASLNRTAVRASRIADEELSGRGDTKRNTYLVVLVADIVTALQRIGIKTPKSRPSEVAKPSVFWQVIEVSFKACNVRISDLYPYLVDGLNLASKMNAVIGEVPNSNRLIDDEAA